MTHAEAVQAGQDVLNNPLTHWHVDYLKQIIAALLPKESEIKPPLEPS